MRDDELIEAIKKGDKDAAEELMRRYKYLVIKSTRPYYIIGAEQDDLVQEGMLGLYRAALSYNVGSNAKFLTYAYQCVKTSIIDAIKIATNKKNSWVKNYVESDFNLKGTGPSPEVIAEQLESSQELVDKIRATLSNREFIVFNLYVAGNSISDITEITNTSYKSVENALQRLRDKIRKNVISTLEIEKI